MNRILLCRTDAVGDLILTLPVVRSIKEQNPDLRVALLVSQYTAPLLSAEPYIDEIVAIPGRGFNDIGLTAAFARDLKKLNLDAILFFYPRLSLAFAGWQARIPIRIGTGRRAYSLLFNHRVSLHRRDSGKHELDLNYELADSTFPGLIRHEPSLVATEAELTQARSILDAHSVGEAEKWAIIHPRSHGSAPNWSVERYLQLTEKLTDKGIRVVTTGSALEADILQEAFGGPAANSDSRIINLAGMTSLPELKGLIKLAPLLISGSTGPIHIAAALGTETIGIYPPQSALSHVRWGPRGARTKLFSPLESNPKDPNRAMDQIQVDDVVNYVSDIYARV